MIFTGHLGRYEKLLQQKYEVSKSIWHKGERGRNRENGLLMFLRETLPAAYGVATGEIFPFQGPKPSPQCDIILYDRLRSPIFGTEGLTQQVPLEGVYAVIECKSVIDSKALRDSKKKFSAIKQLPRCETKPKNSKNTNSGPLFYLFGYRLAASTEACLGLMRTFSESKNLEIVALDHGMGIFLSDVEKPVWVRTTDPENNYHETLAFFLVTLLCGVRDVELGSTNFIEYLTGE